MRGGILLKKVEGNKEGEPYWRSFESPWIAKLNEK